MPFYLSLFMTIVALPQMYWLRYSSPAVDDHLDLGSAQLYTAKRLDKNKWETPRKVWKYADEPSSAMNPSWAGLFNGFSLGNITLGLAEDNPTVLASIPSTHSPSSIFSGHEIFSIKDDISVPVQVDGTTDGHPCIQLGAGSGTSFAASGNSYSIGPWKYKNKWWLISLAGPLIVNSDTPVLLTPNNIAVYRSEDNKATWIRCDSANEISMLDGSDIFVSNEPQDFTQNSGYYWDGVSRYIYVVFAKPIVYTTDPFTGFPSGVRNTIYLMEFDMEGNTDTGKWGTPHDAVPINTNFLNRPLVRSIVKTNSGDTAVFFKDGGANKVQMARLHAGTWTFADLMVPAQLIANDGIGKNVHFSQTILDPDDKTVHVFINWEIIDSSLPRPPSFSSTYIAYYVTVNLDTMVISDPVQFTLDLGLSFISWDFGHGIILNNSLWMPFSHWNGFTFVPAILVGTPLSNPVWSLEVVDPSQDKDIVATATFLIFAKTEVTSILKVASILTKKTPAALHKRVDIYTTGGSGATGGVNGKGGSGNGGGSGGGGIPSSCGGSGTFSSYVANVVAATFNPGSTTAGDWSDVTVDVAATLGSIFIKSSGMPDIHVGIAVGDGTEIWVYAQIVDQCGNVVGFASPTISPGDVFTEFIPFLFITTVSPIGVPSGVGWGTTLGAQGGKPPYTWSVLSGSLPPSATLDPATGAITGTAITVGLPVTATLQVTDSVGTTATTVITFNFI